MIVRNARADDASAICAIWNHFIRETLATFNSTEKSEAEVADTITSRQAEGKAFLVCEREATVVGFATYFQFRGGVGYRRTMEHTILLLPSEVGRGVGRALLSSIEDHAREAGHGSIFAGVSSGNPDGVAFHKRLGYHEVAILPAVGWKWEKWWDLHLLQKRL